jgi:hypothetical protein
MNAPDRLLTEELARSLIGELAPGELPLFGAMSRAWFDAPERVRLATGRDDALAFGVAEAGALFTPVLLSASTHILTYLGQELCRGAARELASRIIGQLRRLILGEPNEIALTERQIDTVRRIAMETASRFRVPEPKARQLAKALASRLSAHG